MSRRSTIRRWLRPLALGLSILLAIVAAYYTIVVIRARSVTAERFAAALGAETTVLAPSELSADRLHALLAVQDPGFFEHRGWDFAGGTMTTITQSLVKVLYYERFRPGIRKIEQSLIARFALDPLVSKDDQLELFLNIVYLGTVEGSAIHGFSRGAEFYFGKRFDELTYDQFLSLLALLPAPNRLDPARHPEANARRVAQIRRLLAGQCDRGGLFGREPNCWSEDPP